MDTDKFSCVYKFEIDEIKEVAQISVIWLGILKPWYLSVDTSLDGNVWEKMVPWKITLPPLF